MTKKYLVIGALAASALGSTLAYAGQKLESPVTVTLNADHSGQMSGALGSTRNAGNASGVLECWVNTNAFAGQTTRSLNCQGSDGKTTVLCATLDPVMIDSGLHLQGDSFVSIQWDTQFTCTSFQIVNSSRMAPKQP